MGCMNGRCSDDSTDQLIHQPPPSHSISDSDYTVTPLPGSPLVTDHPRTLSGNGYLQRPGNDGFSKSSGGTLSKELEQHPSITSTQELDNHHREANQYVVTQDSHTALQQKGVASSSVPTQPPVTIDDVRTARGKEIFRNLRKSYEWKDQFDHPSQEFLALMDRLYMECQVHLTDLSSSGNLEHRREADMIVQEMITVRNHWGHTLLPNSICNAFVRERVPMTLGSKDRQFRIDCAQFFEPVPFYGSQQQAGNPGELMKLYRFSVYDLARNEVVLRYYLERSNVTQLYHVLCFTCEIYRGQVHPYGSELPSYWDIRQRMLDDVYSRLMSALSPGSHTPPQPHVATLFPHTQSNGSIVIQVPSRN